MAYYIALFPHPVHQHTGCPGATVLRACLVNVSDRTLDLALVEKWHDPELLDRDDPAPNHDRVLLILRLPAGMAQDLAPLFQNYSGLSSGNSGSPALRYCVSFSAIAE